MKHILRLMLAFMFWILTEYYRTASPLVIVLLVDSFTILVIVWAEIVQKAYAQRYFAKLGKWFALAFLILVLIPETV